MPDLIPVNRIQDDLYEGKVFGGQERKAKPEIFVGRYTIRNPHKDNGNFIFDQ